MRRLFALITAALAVVSLAACGRGIEPFPTAVPTAAPTASPAPSASPTAVAVPTIAPSPTPSEAVLYCPSAVAEASQAYQDALAAVTAGNLEQAETLFKRAIELDPQFCDAMDNLAGLLRSQDRLDEAVTWLEKSLQVYPNDASALDSLGYLYTLLGKPDKAVEAYLNLTKLEPDNPAGYYGMGMAYYISQDFELAALSLAQAEARLDANSPYLTDTRYLLGMSLVYLQQYDQALPYLLAVYPQLTDDAGLNYSLGLCYLYGSQKDTAEAKKYIEEAVRLGLEIPEDMRQELAKEGIEV